MSQNGKQRWEKSKFVVNHAVISLVTKCPSCGRWPTNESHSDHLEWTDRALNGDKGLTFVDAMGHMFKCDCDRVPNNKLLILILEEIQWLNRYLISSFK